MKKGVIIINGMISKTRLQQSERRTQLKFSYEHFFKNDENER